MKIIDYKLEIYKEILDRPLGDSNGPSGNDLIYSSILKIETDEGITGIAPLGNEYVKEFFPILENEDPREVFSIWKKMIDFVFKGGDEGEAHGALSAVDIALWDIKAKINSEPLWKTLGSNEPRSKVYASDIGYNLTDEELHSFFSKMAEKGVLFLNRTSPVGRAVVTLRGFAKAKARLLVRILVVRIWEGFW